jgi:hypothetical protein
MIQMDEKPKTESQNELMTYLMKDNEKFLREKLGLVSYKKDERYKPETLSIFKINDLEIPVLHPLDCNKNWADIPCFDEKDSSIVIVEIKSSEVANHKTFGQILYYLTLAKRIKYANGKEVKSPAKGIVLASEIHETLRTLVKEYEIAIPKIELKYYRRTNMGDYNFYDAKGGRLRKKS